MIRSTCILLTLLLASRPNCLGQEENDRIHHVIYFGLRQAISGGLLKYVSDTNGNNSGRLHPLPISYNDVNHELTGWMQTKYESLHDANWIKGKHERTLVQIKDEMEALVNANRMDFDVNKGETETDAINRFLVTVLEETYSLHRTGDLATNPLSDYRFLLGGTWTHRDSGSAKGITTASMFVRTRIADPRGKITASTSRKETWFIDFMIHAHFVTNQAVIADTSFDISKPDSSLRLLDAVASSEVSLALFIVAPWRFSDWGCVGLVPRFSASTQEGKQDVFRRFSWSLRFENRSQLIIRGASLELGLTSKDTPGAAEKGFSLFESERFLMDMEIPLTSKKNRLGIYVQFHGEWPAKDRKKQSETNPSIYQFRVGATYDPAKLLGPLFGLAN